MSSCCGQAPWLPTVWYELLALAVAMRGYLALRALRDYAKERTHSMCEDAATGATQMLPPPLSWRVALKLLYSQRPVLLQDTNVTRIASLTGRSASAASCCLPRSPARCGCGCLPRLAARSLVPQVSCLAGVFVWSFFTLAFAMHVAERDCNPAFEDCTRCDPRASGAGGGT